MRIEPQFSPLRRLVPRVLCPHKCGRNNMPVWHLPSVVSSLAELDAMSALGSLRSNTRDLTRDLRDYTGWRLLHGKRPGGWL